MSEKSPIRRLVLLLSVAVLLIVVGLGLWYFNFSQSEEEVAEVTDEDSSQIDNSSADIGSDQMASSGQGGQNQNDNVVRYGDYNDGFYGALDENDQAILFFKASWCSTCSGLDEDIETNKENIPENYYIAKVDFDEQFDLLAKYEVYVQHTLVLTDGEGNMLHKWTGSSTLEDVLVKSNLQDSEEGIGQFLD